ncbi:Arginine biosynthesis bifunctional protein ArgJ [Candidatus Kinetoplastibacterium sorsogonicusi]|uniref:Arginine biosynthesis bifunctional protein ArgJ n=1 Tax=Candidatus Kinetoplastidibacterium kentomonadis TaxID=1576550 RepID=A0A3Q8F358_9PROT|nr:bifunctional glutamate N-acetyltransferase/amino-acid acetyltransferase ArgJ [Candidatus Kinetoplastibacterium sorsogonicusi]AWD32213.1 Arginine biosynthesis bifunctional protein ArgJ [Candidatus Kinetoplastibacterium sorsogonicusi]
MAINLMVPDIDDIHNVDGVKIGIASAGIKKTNKNDLTIFTFTSGTNVAGVFTKNLFCAPPVQICKNHLNIEEHFAGMIINTGIANSGTGTKGIYDALKVCESFSKLLNVNVEKILPFSTGVILENLPSDKIIHAIPIAMGNLTKNNWYNAAHSIMTTDTLPKIYSKKIKINKEDVVITGISKGAGMIMPNMATMLAFICTDIGIDKSLLNDMIKDIVKVSFNAITVDGDTSTNDSFIIAATGKSKIFIESKENIYYSLVFNELKNAAIDLAQKIIRDGEGATKFVTIQVINAKNSILAKQVGYSIANSPLVKTALYASDPNLGRIISAIGQTCLEEIDINKIDIYIGNLLILKNGSKSENYIEKLAKNIMLEKEIVFTISLNNGIISETIYTCDLSNQYIDINANYRS